MATAMIGTETEKRRRSNNGGAGVEGKILGLGFSFRFQLG